ncbi:hypothetical protein F4677DRAFT_6696 [Hypoxylon crocopeplum]|nr:hypothetical protein F4677DRAFT_6696 [Hypoxylon crocopeplum]
MSWPLIALFRSAPILEWALPSPFDQGVPKSIRLSDDLRASIMERGGQTFDDLPTRQSAYSSDKCGAHSTSTGVGAGSGPVVYECNWSINWDH